MTGYAGLNVLVTGATGLIGSHLTHALLAAGARVHILRLLPDRPDNLLARSGDEKQVTIHQGRLEDAAAVTRTVIAAQPRVVFHLGAQTLVGVARQDPVTTFQTNIAGTWHLLEACRGLRIPPLAIAVASSDKAYGVSPRLPYVETDPLAGEEPYEASKAATDILARTYAHTYGLPVRIARCGNVYGSGDLNWSRLVPGTIRSILEATQPVIRSDGTPLRDYIHVDDVVAAYLSLGSMDIPPGEPFNFSSGETKTVREMVELILHAMGSTLEPVLLNDAPGELAAQWLDSSKAREQLGWTTRRTLGESLPGVAAWYRELLG